MKNRIFFLTATYVISLILAASCSQEESLSELEKHTATSFYAYVDTDGTKTILENGDSETESHPVLWTPGDAIGITTDATFGQYTYNGTENTASAEFEGAPIEGSMFYAVYPYSEDASLSNGILTLYLPERQEYSPLSFGPASSPMVARSENTALGFRNLCGLFKLNLTGSGTVSTITFQADGAGVSGQATVDMNYSSTPELTMTAEASSSVTLDCGEGVALNGSTAVPFYIVLPAATYDNFTLTILTAEGKIMTKNGSGLVINRSMVRPTSDLEFTPDEVQVDRNALMAFYNATDGPNWADNTNWGTDEPLDTWYGITVNSEGRVTEIILKNNRLSGDAGNTLAHLTELTTLNCYNNSLTSIDISYNTNLTSVDFSYNQLTTLDVSNNTNLTTLLCGNNDLSTLDISYNTALTYLHCASNRLSSLDIRENPAITNILTGLQTGEDGDYEDMFLYVTEEQLQLWNSSWVNNTNNQYVLVSTQKDFMDLSPTSFEVPAAGDEIAVSIFTDLSYTIQIQNPDWITLVSGEGVRLGELVFSIAPNTSTAGRSGMIMVCAGTNCYNITVSQAAGNTGEDPWYNKTFYHRSLAMRFTATWCGYCPNMAEAFSLVQEQIPGKLETVNFHGGSSDLEFGPTSTLISQYGIEGFPSGIVDGRFLVQNYDKDYIATLVTNTVDETEANYPTASGISFNSSISGRTLDTDITLYLKNADNYKITVVVLEDGIIGYQANYYTSASDNYVHDAVARIAMTDILGESFSTSSDNTTRTFHYSAEIPADYNMDNLRILVYVQRAFGSQPVISSGDYGGYYVDNCVSGKAGTSVELVTLEDMEDIGGGNEDFGNDDRYEW